MCRLEPCQYPQCSKANLPPTICKSSQNARTYCVFPDSFTSLYIQLSVRRDAYMLPKYLSKSPQILSQSSTSPALLQLENWLESSDPIGRGRQSLHEIARTDLYAMNSVYIGYSAKFAICGILPHQPLSKCETSARDGTAFGLFKVCCRYPDAVWRRLARLV